jgi:hypothetical protein
MAANSKAAKRFWLIRDFGDITSRREDTGEQGIKE